MACLLLALEVNAFDMLLCFMMAEQFDKISMFLRLDGSGITIKVDRLDTSKGALASRNICVKNLMAGRMDIPFLVSKCHMVLILILMCVCFCCFGLKLKATPIY